MNRRSIIRLIAILFVPLCVLAFISYILVQIPTSGKLHSCFTAKMNNVSLCPGSKNYLPLTRISPVMRKTVILTEDSGFYQHDGFDWDSIERSAKENLQKGQYVRGGSTISQQLAKNLFLSKDKTILRKLIEGLITVKIELSLSKDEILEKYLNVIEFGKGIFGIKAASEFYFKKEAAGLTAAESAFLAMLLPNPVKYSVSYKRKELSHFAESRMRKILNDMYRYDRIDQVAYEEALVQMQTLFSDEKMDLLAPKWTDQFENTPDPKDEIDLGPPTDKEDSNPKDTI